MKVLPLYLPQQGCRHQCVYCNQPLTVGSPNERELWQDRLQWTLENTCDESWEIAFFGGTFSALPLEEMEGCFAETVAYLSDEKVQGIRISTRPDAVSGETLEYLRRRGVRTIELGVESLDDDVLRRSGRGHSALEARDACLRVKQYGFLLGIHLMCGLPGQGEASWKHTVLEALKLPLDMVRIAPTLVLKDTPLEKLYRRGVYQPMEVEKAIMQCAFAYQHFYAKGVAIARVGLGISDAEGCGEEKIVAGPWHPALRHEVESRLVRQNVLNMLSRESESRIDIHPKDISIVQGERKKNLEYWQTRLGLQVEIRRDEDVPRHRFRLGDDRMYSLFIECYP